MFGRPSLGLPNFAARAAHGAGMLDVVSYMRDLWKARELSLGYSDAFSAQMLNQQLFFQHFPSAGEESIRRMRELMIVIRRENPGITLVMSPIPSYELVGGQQVDNALLRTLKRLPITYDEGRRQEGGMYDAFANSRMRSSGSSWMTSPRYAVIGGPLASYNDFDYHLLPECRRSRRTGSSGGAVTYHRSHRAGSSGSRALFRTPGDSCARGVAEEFLVDRDVLPNGMFRRIPAPDLSGSSPSLCPRGFRRIAQRNDGPGVARWFLVFYERSQRAASQHFGNCTHGMADYWDASASPRARSLAVPRDPR